MSDEHQLGLAARLLLRAVFLLGAVASIMVGLRVDPTELLAKGGASDDALRRRRSIARRLREESVRPADIATPNDLFKGEYALEAGLPESFNVLIKELQSLCLNVELVEGPSTPAGAAAAEE